MANLGPWPVYPEKSASKAFSLLYPLPLDSELAPKAQKILNHLHESLNFFKNKKLSFEILIVPYGSNKDLFYPKFAAIDTLCKATPELKLFFVNGLRNRALALREAFLRSHGEALIFVDAEQPCSLDFWDEAIHFFQAGYNLIRANRRLAKSRFKTPVRLLPYIYRRHGMSKLHNFLLRHLFPIATTDVQSTNYLVKRNLAFEIFALQSSSGMSFEVEVALIAALQKAKSLDLPFQILLSEEKSTNRVMSESVAIFKEIFRVWLRYLDGFYRSFELQHSVSADDWGLSPGVNRGILRLAKLGVVSRVALMATEPYVEEGLLELQKIPGIELGLHFNLTHGTKQRLGPRSPGNFLVHWLKNRSALKDSVRAELSQQLSRLASAGVRASYLDGHHHSHLAPGLIDDVADILKAHDIKQLRLPLDPSLSFSSKIVLNLLSLWARPAFKRHDFKWQKCFYPQTADFSDQALFRYRLGKRLNREVIVHPAELNDVKDLPEPDDYSEGRILEFQALRMLPVGKNQ